MKANTIIAGLLSSTLLATAAYAQTPAPADSTRTMSKSTSASESQHMGQWRASKLIGVNVYNQGNEKLGDISEMLIDSEGRIQGVVIGVGGFLGVGQRDVAVTFDKLQLGQHAGFVQYRDEQPDHSGGFGHFDRIAGRHHHRRGNFDHGREQCGSLVSGPRGAECHQGSAEVDAGVQVLQVSDQIF